MEKAFFELRESNLSAFLLTAQRHLKLLALHPVMADCHMAQMMDIFIQSPPTFADRVPPTKSLSVVTRQRVALTMLLVNGGNGSLQLASQMGEGRLSRFLTLAHLPRRLLLREDSSLKLLQLALIGKVTLLRFLED